MASRRLSCRWCGMPTLVPLGAQFLRCPSCGHSTTLYTNSNSFPPSGNTFVTNPGYGQPTNWNMVRAQIQPHLAPPAYGRKRALLCGITYKENRKSLNGSINDVFYMKKLLVERFGFPSSCIVVLTEEEDISHIPTKRNIRAAMRWLVQGCQPGDSLVFHYSGHASQVRDHDGDEVDGFDESLLPVDYETEGRILDDEINATIVKPLPTGATLHSIIDTCFSGTFIDLPNVCRINRDGYYKWENHHTQHAYKGTSGGHAISISACDDHQNSGDTTVLQLQFIPPVWFATYYPRTGFTGSMPSGGAGGGYRFSCPKKAKVFTGVPIGALTYSFVQTLKEQPRLTYAQLLIVMHKKIDAARHEVGLNSHEPHKSKEPLLSSSHKFDIYSKDFTL